MEELPEHFNMVEFAENYFNAHEKSPNGTLVGTLKRSSKNTEWLSKSEMISYYKGASIPNSHIHLFDPENVNLACVIFKVGTLYSTMLHMLSKCEVKAQKSRINLPLSLNLV